MMRVIPDDVWGAMTVYCEARGETYAGQVAVARVTRNRVRQGFARDVAGVVLAPYQFSCWNTQDPNRLVAARLDSDDPRLQQCQRAWAESATNDAGVGDATMYYAPSGVAHVPSWAKPEKFVIQIGAHHFFLG